jgi:hypothetical protein
MKDDDKTNLSLSNKINLLQFTEVTPNLEFSIIQRCFSISKFTYLFTVIFLDSMAMTQTYALWVHLRILSLMNHAAVATTTVLHMCN